MKPRILMVNEFSGVSTGYSNYGRQLLNFLHSTGKYEVAELACYCAPGDPRLSEFPWRIYPNLPHMEDQQGANAYQSDPINQFGKFTFESVCLDFKPTHVIDIRDVWMWDFEGDSPYRNFFNWLVLAPCDGEHQAAEWLYKFTQPDKLFSYCDWNFKQLEKEGNGLLTLEAACPPCVEHDIFKPVKDKKAHKKMLGVREDSLVVMTVNRNQKRKLYPDLLKSFSRLVEISPKNIADRLFLYLHTAFPDLGWNIPELILENGLSSKVLLTYLCKNCSLVMPRFYCDSRGFCPRCGQYEMILPNTQFGITREALADIMNLADVAVQLANSEGFGIFQTEAAALGLPLFSLDYSAMSDVVRKVGGYAIPYKALQTEAETSVLRAVADTEALAQKLSSFFQQPEHLRIKKGKETHEKAVKHYSWKDTFAKWEAAIDSLPTKGGWDSPARFIPNFQLPDHTHWSESSFVEWAIVNILNKPELLNSYFAMKLERDLTWTCRIDQQGAGIFSDLSLLGNRPAYRPFTRQDLINELSKEASRHNFWEQRRTEKL